MPKFSYKAKEGISNIVSGTLEANSEADAINRVIRLGLTPISVKQESGTRESFSKSSAKVSLGDIATFSRQLSALLDAGVNLLRALNTIKLQSENEKFSSVMEEVATSVREGASFSDSLSRYPKIFSPVYIAMVRAGEQGGMLSRILSQITDVMDKEEGLRSKITTSLVYPIFLLVIGSASVFVLLTFVIPRIVGIFQELNQSLPLPTTILIGISNFLGSFWYFMVAIIAFVFFIINRYYSTHEGRLHFDKIKISLPVFGNFFAQVEFTHFTRTLGSLLANGVPIVQALRSAIATLDNAVLKEELETVSSQVTKGASLTTAVSASSYFPDFINNMISIGEETGALDRSLLRIADIYDKEIDKTIKILTSLIEPVLILFFGLIVGFIVVAMLLPVLQISASVG